MPGGSPDQLPAARAHLLERQRSYQRAATRPDGAAAPESARRQETPRFHVVAAATGWRSAFGGLNTLNRDLCCALAAAGSTVVCLVPQAEAAEVADARSREVRLIEEPGLLSGMAVPEWPPGFSPDLIIGHGRVTGPAARHLAARLPGIRRLHVVHVAPDEIDPYRPGRSDDQGSSSEERTNTEIELGRDAYRIVAVGPRLHDRYVTEFGPVASAPVLQLDPGFDSTAPLMPVPPGGAPWRVFFFGRTEDPGLKGLDIGARAVALAAAWRGKRSTDIEFWVRGAPQGSCDRLRDEMRAWAGSVGTKIVVRTFTTDPAELRNDMGRASLVLMPSRAEGFGLTGLEAITAGIPVLVSEASGLGALLSGLLPDEAVYRTVVAMDGDFSQVADRWARSIDAVLRDREAAFSQARRMKAHLATRHTWSMAATALLNSLDRSR